MTKLWGNYGGGRGQKFWNTTGFHDAYFSFLWTSRLCFFNERLYYDAFSEVLRKSLKGKKIVPKCSKYKDR